MKTLYLEVNVPDDDWDTLTENAQDIARKLEVELVGLGYTAMAQPVRNGVLLKVAQAQRALDALEGLDSLPEDYMSALPADHEAAAAIRACLEVIERHGG